MTSGAWICLLAPLAGAVVITLAGTRISRRAAAYLSTLSVAVSFAGAAVAFFDAVGKDAEEREHVTTAWTWLSAGELDFGLSLLVDPLSLMMMLIVSGVGGLIVAYSIGYMDGDEEERRYFAYMALFVFSMLLLVMAANFLILLAGWGLVGLASYLLIGFWHERPSAISAAKKAFIMNAFGDATMALALFLLIQQTGTLEFGGAFAEADGLSSTIANLVALGLLGGAVAKSAQIPLHTWLPDAMEGPTPVSALIHAATMVTAGVYLICRANPLFEAAPTIQDLAAGLGTATLVAAGLIALVQTDIKRVIAYSTMSQIGYMFLGAGIGAYGAGMFHLMTHAFFKALLFMAAGVAIHALAGEQDIRRMGGLRHRMRWTWIAMLIGSLALVGIPPFSGFFSKDSILAAALASGTYGQILWALGLAGAFLTGLYTFRMFFIVFGGAESAFVREHLFSGHGASHHAHELEPSEPGDEPTRVHADAPEHATGHGEGPFSMLAPVAVLAVLAVVGGWIQFANQWHLVTDWLHDVAEPLVEPTGGEDALTSVLAVGLGLAGIAVAWWIYSARRAAAPATGREPLERKLYFDDLYDWIFYKPADLVSRLLGRGVEDPIIAGSVTGVAAGTRVVGGSVGRVQTGLLRSYALAIAGALAVLAVVFISVR